MDEDQSSLDHAVNQSDIQSAKRRMAAGEGLSDIMETNSELIRQRMLRPFAGLLFVVAAILTISGYFWVAVVMAFLCVAVWAYAGFKKLRNEEVKRQADAMSKRHNAGGGKVD